jgi:hypothetical protein
MQEYGKLTCASLLYLLCRNSQDIQYFNHYLHYDVRHRRVWSNLGIGLQAPEEVLDAFKDVNKSLLSSDNILSRLRSFRVKPGSVAKRCLERYRPVGGHQHLRRSLSRVRKPASSLLKSWSQNDITLSTYQTNPIAKGS